MKGLLQSFEAVMTILAILLFFIIYFTPKQEITEFESVNWKLRGFYALQTLDKNNELRQYVSANNNATIMNKLSEILPANLNYNVSICTTNCSNPTEIQSEKMVSVNYLISGDIRDFRPKQIVLFVW